MTEQDFVLMGITRITPQMVRDTGAQLEDVQAETIGKLNRAANLLNVDVVLMRNGLTTGDHVAETHPRGQAVDFAVAGLSEMAEPVFKALLEVGYHGIGIYWNGTVFSFHADTRRGYSFWTAVKQDGKWVYGPLINNPRLQKE